MKSKMTQKIRGIVDWYDEEKGYGVIRGENGNDYFIHHSNLSLSLKKGFHVIFQTRPRSHNKQGFEAYDVSLESYDDFSKEKKNDSRILPINGKKFTEDKSKINYANKLINEKQTDVSSTKVNTIQPQSFKSLIFTKLHRLIHIENGYITDRVKGTYYYQKTVSRLSLKDIVYLQREPENPFDQNAIKIEDNSGETIGHIDRELASIIAGQFDNYNQRIPATVVRLSDGIVSSREVWIEFLIPGFNSN